MARKRKAPAKKKRVENITHDEASRKNIPTEEHRPVMADDERSALRLAYERRNRDLDPQLVWRGKDEQDRSDLLVQAPPLYIQEKVQPKALVDDLQRASRQPNDADVADTPDLFADFNGIPEGADKTEFYQHDQNWLNRMILGDSLQVMASLAEREGLRGKVQCIYVDPPYGIRFNSNFQWSTTSRDVKDGKAEHINREPEQVKAFRDTWRDGVHTYLSYLRDRFTVAKDLLSDSGSIFVQIGDENVHRVRALLDEVFGADSFVSLITCRTSSGTTAANSVKRVSDYIVWYCRQPDRVKFRRLLGEKPIGDQYNQLQVSVGNRRSMTDSEKTDPGTIPSGSRVFTTLPMHSMTAGDHTPRELYNAQWRIPTMRSWRFSMEGFHRLARADRIAAGKTVLRTVYFQDDYAAAEITNTWTDTGPEQAKSYVVQTSVTPITRCILMTTDPGDLVLDPTCGSGTTAYVAEQWGRRWITVDTSRVALALARARIMGANYPWYVLADSPAGQQKEAQLRRTAPSETPTRGDIRQGFVYERVPHIEPRGIANNAEIDVIYDRHQAVLEPLRERLNALLDTSWEEWEVPPPPPPRASDAADPTGDWPVEAKDVYAEWWQVRVARQREIDASIAANAEFEYRYDKPYEDDNTVRVAGPFTVESLSPHRVLPVDDAGAGFEASPDTGRASRQDHADFAQVILENLRSAGVQQAHREGRIALATVEGWPGKLVCAEARYFEGEAENVAGIFIGPEFGTVSRPDLVAAAKEAAEAGFDVLVACGFNFDAHSADFDKLGRIPVLKARMNADLHMASELKNTGKGNLFVVFGEPDIEVIPAPDDMIQVKVVGVDVYRPQTGEVVASETDDIALWMIDTDYDEESFFVRHAYFLGANDPYKALKTTLKAEIDEEAWASLHSDTSRPFARPESGRIAVKVINHLGDEVMKVITV